MKNLYDSFLQFITNTTWGQFIARAPGDPQSAVTVKSIFQQDMYAYAGYYLLALTILALAYYYFILNRKGGSGYGFKLKYWIITMIVSALSLAALTTWTTNSLVNRFLDLHTFKLCLGLGVINGIYLIVAFTLLSIVLKRFSSANRTPF
ncbi:hypothetical protein AAFN85_25990 [Mucilaginibacter sp. CAU 1740]|uniref:hypothetical protein n=1 Tax=Mucilaginibacter sp. CAU 1740 TaxID=3140365 RepID=UPI00325BE8BC